MRARGLLLLGATVAFAVGTPTLAAARARPHVSLSIPSSVEAGAPISAQWTAMHVPRDASMIIEKPVGTGKVWKPLAPALRGRSGTLMLPAYASFGVYQLRIAVIKSRKVLAQQERRVRVFAEIPFSNLLENTSLGGLHATPTAAFPYTLPLQVSVGSRNEGSRTDLISDEHSNCDLIRVDFSSDPLPVSEFGGEPGQTPQDGRVTVTVVQESAEPISSTPVPTDRVGSLEAHVALGQSWAVNATVSNVRTDALELYFNGQAHCYSSRRFMNGTP